MDSLCGFQVHQLKCDVFEINLPAFQTERRERKKKTNWFHANQHYVRTWNIIDRSAKKPCELDEYLKMRKTIIFYCRFIDETKNNLCILLEFANGNFSVVSIFFLFLFWHFHFEESSAKWFIPWWDGELRWFSSVQTPSIKDDLLIYLFVVFFFINCGLRIIHKSMSN